MQKKPTNERIQALIRGIQARTEEVPDGRAGFALMAIYCQVNEGLCPSITGGLRCRDFNFKEMFVEFAPFHDAPIVRRPLSQETAACLQAHTKKYGRSPDDLIHGFNPKRPARWKNHKARKITRNFFGRYNQALKSEVGLAGFEWQEFHFRKLAWVWLDQHPKARDLELRSGLLAKSVLRWSPREQQEALCRKIYEDIPVLRPSWTYPDWHKDARKPAVNGDGSTAGNGGSEPPAVSATSP